MMWPYDAIPDNLDILQPGGITKHGPCLHLFCSSPGWAGPHWRHNFPLRSGKTNTDESERSKKGARIETRRWMKARWNLATGMQTVFSWPRGFSRPVTGVAAACSIWLRTAIPSHSPEWPTELQNMRKKTCPHTHSTCLSKAVNSAAVKHKRY